MTRRLNGRKWFQHELCSRSTDLVQLHPKGAQSTCSRRSCKPTGAAARTEIYSKSTLLLQTAMLMQRYQLINISTLELVLITKIVNSERESRTAKLQRSERFHGNAAERGLIAAVSARAGADFPSSCRDSLPIPGPSRQTAKPTAASLRPRCQAPVLLPCPPLQHQPSAFPLPCPLRCPEAKVTHLARSERCGSQDT